MSGQPLPEHGVCCSPQPAKDKVDKEKRKPTAYNLFVQAESGNLRKADNQATQQVGAPASFAWSTNAVHASFPWSTNAGVCTHLDADRGVRARIPTVSAVGHGISGAQTGGANFQRGAGGVLGFDVSFGTDAHTHWAIACRECW